MRRALVVISPTVLPHLRQNVRECLATAPSDWACEVVEVPPKDDIVEVARTARDGRYQRVLAMGGDGTVAAVVQDAHEVARGKAVPLVAPPADKEIGELHRKRSERPQQLRHDLVCAR